MKRVNVESSSKKNQYMFDILEDKKLKISSKFQSGNIRLVRQVSSLSYVLESVSDVEGVLSKKSWYCFKMQCCGGYRVRISLQNVNILEYCQDNKAEYQPLCKIGQKGEWKSLNSAFLSDNQDIGLLFDYKFTNEEEVFFSLSVPFTYSDSTSYLKSLEDEISHHILFKNELLALTPEKREVRLLSITQNGKDSIERHNNNKPVVFVTCRVHPGEVSASFCLMGMLQMLLQNSLQSYLLRRLFQWKIVPMVNPDGVVAGNYRMDPLGNNLNRCYSEPNAQQHPAIFNIVRMVKEITDSSRNIQFYFDLHGHSSCKEAFIYGNAMDSIVKQSYSQLFCRILEENTLWFRNCYCDFGERQMKFKDRGEEKSKQGCGRVMALKVGKIVRSYTMESSMLPNFYHKFQKNTLKPAKNTQFQYCPSNYTSSLGCPKEGNQRPSHPLVQSNKELGRAMLISILDMVDKNPYTRLNESFNELTLRQLAPKISLNEQRFKLHDGQIYSKIKTIKKIVQEDFQQRLEAAWSKMNLGKQFRNGLQWPTQFKGLKHQSSTSKPKFNRTVRLHSQMTEIKNKPIKIRSRLKTENKVVPQTFLQELGSRKRQRQRQKDKQKNMTKEGAQKSQLLQIEEVTLQRIKKQRQSLQMHYSLEVADRIVDFKQLDIFQRVSQQKVDIYQRPSVKCRYDLRKNTPRSYMVQNLSPSISLAHNSKFVQKQKQKCRKLKVSNFYRAFVENRKRTQSNIKENKSSSPKNPRTRSDFEEKKNKKQDRDRANTQVNKIDMSLIYRQGYQTVKFHHKMQVMFPWMRNNTGKQKKQSSYLRKIQ